MLCNRNAIIFICLSFSSILVHANMIDAVLQIIIDLPRIQIQVQPLFNVIGIIYFAFFGILSQTRLLYFFQDILVPIGIIIVRGYVVHRLLHTSFTKATLRMLWINLLSSVVVLLLSILMFKTLPEQFLLFDIIATLLILSLQVVIASIVYFWFDPSVLKTLLIKTMLIAHLLTLFLLIIIHIIHNWYSFSRLYAFTPISF